MTGTGPSLGGCKTKRKLEKRVGDTGEREAKERRFLFPTRVIHAEMWKIYCYAIGLFGEALTWAMMLFYSSKRYPFQQEHGSKARSRSDECI